MSQGNLKDALIDSVMGDDPFADAYYDDQDDVTIEKATKRTGKRYGFYQSDK